MKSPVTSDFDFISASKPHQEVLFKDSREKHMNNLRSFTFVPLPGLHIVCQKAIALYHRCWLDLGLMIGQSLDKWVDG